MKKSFNVEFWNFVCHFGEAKLLDYYIDLVHPAFIGDFFRKHGESSYFFYDVKIVECEIDEDTLPFVFGRIVKDTIIERDQIFENDELKEDKLLIQNSPSSIFVLSLKDHRLFFVKEHKDAPTMESFKATITKFINDVRTENIDNEYEYLKEQRDFCGGTKRVTTKKSLGVRFPKPDIEIIPLSSDADIDEFIKSMKEINKLQLDLVMPNNESDCNPFFHHWRDKNKNLGNGKSKAIFSNPKKSLPHEKVSTFSKEAINDENVLITITGKDLDNDKLVGTQENFKLTRKINEIEQVPTLFARSIYKTFLKLISDGVIRGPKITDVSKVKDKLKYIMSMIK